jgi:hypothetical protein
LTAKENRCKSDTLGVEAAPTPYTLAALRRVERWPLRSLGVLVLYLAPIAPLTLMGAGHLHPALAVPLSVAAVGGAVVGLRRLAARGEADVEDLRAAGPLLSPDARARAFARLAGSVHRPPQWARRPKIEETRAYLEGLPGGMRLRSNLALRDPDARPLPRAFLLRALVGYPIATVLPVAVAAVADGIPNAVQQTLGALALVGPPLLTYMDGAARDLHVRRRTFWALLSGSCLPLLALTAVAASAGLG